MAKEGGLGDNFYVAGIDLTADINQVNKISGGPAVLDGTAIWQGGNDRFGGLLSGGIDFTSLFNPSAGETHDNLSNLPTVDVIVTYFRGTTLGNPAASVKAKQINYDGTRGNDGSFTFSVQTLSNLYPVEWGISGTAGKRTDTTATVGTAVDQGSASPGAYGLVAYLHVFAFTGTSVTVKLQESSDNAGDAYTDVTGGAFTAATGVTSQRIQTGAINVERYIKVTTTGTFSNAVFAVMFKRFETLPSYS